MGFFADCFKQTEAALENKVLDDLEKRIKWLEEKLIAVVEKKIEERFQGTDVPEIINEIVPEIDIKSEIEKKLNYFN